VKRDPALVRAEGQLADRAFALTLLALVLLTPPILTIFNVPELVFGIPLLHIYCYSAWLLAIIIGAWLAKRLSAGQGGAGSDVEPDERS
jgi:hypothetical protein